MTILFFYDIILLYQLSSFLGFFRKSETFSLFYYLGGGIFLNKNKNIIATVYNLISPVATHDGLIIWNISFDKWGAEWFLRIFIDKSDGSFLSIDDCESFSRKIDPLIDQADPIEQSYYLEVSSPGLERELTKDWHLKKYIGSLVSISLFKPLNNPKTSKNFVAKLIDFNDNDISFELDDNNTKSSITINRSNIATIKLYFNLFDDLNK